MAVKALLDIMEQLAGIHDSLLELAEQKKPALIHNEVEELNRIVHQESGLAKRVGELEQQRMHETGQILISRGYRPDPRVTVSDVIRIVFKADDKKALMEAQTKLVTQIRRLKIMNELNQKLIQQALSFVDYSLDLLYGPPEDEAVYQHPVNQRSHANRSGLFDTRA